MEFTSLEPSAEEKAEYAAREKRQAEKLAEEQHLPKLEGLGFWVPPCTDVFIGNTAYVWYRLLQFTGDCDLDIEPYDGPRIGEPQTWFEEYEDTSNFWYSMRRGHGEWGGFNFALENAIAPGQPFLMQFGPPHWHRCNYGYDEYDVDYDFEIVRKLPRHRVLAERSFSRAIALKKRHDERRARDREQLRVLQRTDISEMFIEQSLYCVNDGYRFDDFPSGKQVAICSNHTALPGRYKSTGRVDLVHGRDPDSWEKALEALFVTAEQVLGLKKEQLQHLEQKWRT